MGNARRGNAGFGADAVVGQRVATSHHPRVGKRHKTQSERARREREESAPETRTRNSLASHRPSCVSPLPLTKQEPEVIRAAVLDCSPYFPHGRCHAALTEPSCRSPTSCPPCGGSRSASESVAAVDSTNTTRCCTQHTLEDRPLRSGYGRTVEDHQGRWGQPLAIYHRQSTTGNLPWAIYHRQSTIGKGSKPDSLCVFHSGRTTDRAAGDRDTQNRARAGGTENAPRPRTETPRRRYRLIHKSPR